MQTVTIRSKPEIGVAYHAIYSDGKDAFEKGYYGGNNGGRTDGRGIWTDQWVIGSEAPPGRVAVDVVAQEPSTGDTGHAQTSFMLAGDDDDCG